MGKSLKLTDEPMTATEKLQKDFSETTNAAVSEGQKNVDQAKAAGAGYVDQVRGLAQGALDTAKVIIYKRGE